MVVVTSSDMVLAEQAVSASEVHLTVTGRFASIDVLRRNHSLLKTFRPFAFFCAGIIYFFIMIYIAMF